MNLATSILVFVIGYIMGFIVECADQNNRRMRYSAAALLEEHSPTLEHLPKHQKHRHAQRRARNFYWLANMGLAVIWGLLYVAAYAIVAGILGL